MDKCGIPAKKEKLEMVNLTDAANACTPGGGCC